MTGNNEAFPSEAERIRFDSTTEEDGDDEHSEEEHPGDETPAMNMSRKIPPVTVRARGIWDRIVEIRRGLQDIHGNSVRPHEEVQR